MRIKRKTYILWYRRLITFCVVFCLCVLGYIFFKTGIFTVTHYEIVGVDEQYRVTLQQQFKAIGEETRYKIIPTNRILTYRKQELQKAVATLLPTTQKVDIDVRGLHTLRVTVTSYTPLFVLEDGRYLTDQGYVYTDSFSPRSTLPTLIALNGSYTTSTVNNLEATSLVFFDDITTSETLRNIVSLLPKINDVLFPVNYITVNEDGDIFFSEKKDIKTVRIHKGSDMDKVWLTLVSAIDTDPLKTLLLTKKELLEYIDLRFGNKVFYRFTNDQAPAIITPHDAITTATTTLH